VKSRPRLLVVGSALERRRALIRTMERSQVFEVVEASSALETIDLVGQRAFLAVVCVWPLAEGQGGLDLVRFLRKNEKNVLIAVVAERVEQWSEREVLRVGADYYFKMPSSELDDLDTVAAHIESGTRGRSVAVTKFDAGDLRVDVSRHQAWRGDRELSLTPIQFRLLVFLLEHVGETISKDALFHECWRRHDDPIDDGTHLVEVHISALRKKLDGSGEPALLQTIRGIGYALRPED
jgi:two-component system OmpR family response regulator